MVKYVGKLIGQMIPPVMATVIGAYLVQQIFPGKKAETQASPPAPTTTVMSPAPLAPANKLAKGASNSLSGPPSEPTEITVPGKTPPVKESVKEAAAPAAAPTPAAAPATTGTIMPRRVGPPGPVPVVARERVEPPPPAPPAPPTREEAAVPPLELAAKVIAALPPSKPASPRDLPETRDGAYVPPPNAALGPPVSVAPLPPPPAATSAPMPITPPAAAAPVPPPMQAEIPRAPLTRDPVQLSNADRENLAAIPTPGPVGVEPPRRPSLFERGGALVKGVVSSVTSVLPGRQ